MRDDGERQADKGAPRTGCGLEITDTENGGKSVGEQWLFARSGSGDGVSSCVHSARRDRV